MNGKLKRFKMIKAKTRYSPRKIPTRLEGDVLDYLRRLELLRRGVSCKGKSPEECRRLAASYGFACDSSKATSFSLRDFPRNLRGEEAAEILVCLKLLEYGIRCKEAEETYIDRLALPAFKEGAKRTPIQVKSMSLAKHGYQIEAWPRPLKLFKGWYIVLIEHEPLDFLLFVPGNEIEKRFKKTKRRRVKKRPSSQARRLEIPSDLGDGWSDYLDPEKFVGDVFS